MKVRMLMGTAVIVAATVAVMGSFVQHPVWALALLALTISLVAHAVAPDSGFGMPGALAASLVGGLLLIGLVVIGGGGIGDDC